MHYLCMTHHCKLFCCLHMAGDCTCCMMFRQTGDSMWALKSTEHSLLLLTTCSNLLYAIGWLSKCPHKPEEIERAGVHISWSWGVCHIARRHQQLAGTPRSAAVSLWPRKAARKHQHAAKAGHFTNGRLQVPTVRMLPAKAHQTGSRLPACSAGALHNLACCVLR